MSIEEQMEALFAAPAPAVEVVTLEATTVETILNELEQADPLRSIVVELRAKLAEPKVDLWAMFTIGANEIYPARDRAHAESMYANLMDACARYKQRRIDDGDSMEEWEDWKAEIIPSPFEPADHFEILAGETLDKEAHIRKLWAKCDDDRSKLLASLVQLIGNLDMAGVTDIPAIQAAQETVIDVTAEEVARKKHLDEMRAKHEANCERARAACATKEGVQAEQ